MKRSLALAALLLATAVSLGACVVEGPPGPPPRYGLHWVPGHYGPYGHWIPGHWA